MMPYQISVTRDARCTLLTTISVEADSREEAENKAIRQSECELDESAFTVTSIDLSSVEGSSNVVDIQEAA